MKLSKVINSDSSLLHIEDKLRSTLDFGDIIVGILAKSKNYTLVYEHWDIANIDNYKTVRSKKKIANANSILRTAIYGNQKWSKKYDYEQSPVSFEPDIHKFPMCIGKEVLIFRSITRVGKGVCFALLLCKKRNPQREFLLHRLVSGLSQKQASKILGDSLHLTNEALKASRIKYGRREETNVISKLIQKSALTPHIAYWTKPAGDSVLKRSINMAGVDFDLVSKDKLLENIENDSFRTITRLRGRDLSDYMAQVVIDWAVEKNLQSLIVRSIHINAELAGILICAYSNPIFPRELIKIMLNGVDHLLTDYLFSDFSMGEAQVQIDRLRASQPLIFAGLQSSLKIHDSIPLLGNVQLALERVSKELIGEPQAHDISKIRVDLEEVHGSLKTAMKIADFSQYDYGEVKIFDCVERVKEWALKQLKEHDIDLSNNISQDTIIYGDSEAFEQVFMNLISNAIYFLAKDNSVEKRTITITESRRKDYLEIAVIDNGPGVENGKHEKIFEFLVSFKEKGKGTGVGLSVSKLIIEYYNGKILSIPSSKGATFSLRFPLN